MAEVESTENLPDQSEENHPAVAVLKELRESNQIANDVYESLLFKFKKLHQAFTQSCSTEQILLRRTRDLNKELKAQKMTIQNSATQQQEHRTALTAIRQFVTNIQSELEATHEQIEATRSNTTLKKREREKLAEKVAKARDDQMLKLEPQKKQIQLEIQALDEAIAQRQQNIEGLKNSATNLANRLTKCEEQLNEIEKSKKSMDQKMLEVSSFPVKTRQKSSAVESSHNAMLSEEKAVNQQLAVTEGSLQKLQTQSHDFETEYQHMTNDVEGMTQVVSDLRAKAEELRQKCGEQTTVRQQYEYESRRIAKLVQEQKKEVQAMEQKLSGIVKDIAKKEKEAQRLQEAITRIQTDSSTLTTQLNSLLGDEQHEKEANQQLKKQRDNAMNAKETAAKAILAVETVNQQTLDDIKDALTQKDRKQSIHDQLSKKEQELQTQLTEVSLIRDRRAREMTGMKKKTLDAKTLAMERNLDYMDLCRKLEQNQQRVKDCSEMYEKVKLDRNKNVNHIQTSRQLIVEYNEKIRILDNEVQVLRAEFEAVDVAVRLQKSELQQAYKRRDQTRSDLRKAEMGYKELQQKIDYQMSETSRMNLVLQNIEDMIQHHQNRYSIQSYDCFNIQRMLIDKQDELCLIYEKFNRHEEVMKRGEIALREREEEYRLLNLQLKDFLRQIDIMKKKVPQLKAYQAEIDELDGQLDRERADVDKITAKLESPDLKERQRQYCGKDFTLKELEDKVSLYEQRINAKEQQLWEKQILLREIEEKISSLSSEQLDEKQKSAKVVEKGSNLRAESMSLRRKKMAALAENAVYRAQKAELEEEKQAVKDEIQRAEERTQRGEAFDEYADRMVRMHERDAAGQSRRAGLESDDEEERRPGRQHYDAYPTADGLSRPYGAFPVFQPAPPPGHLRHYRKETERPIEL